MTVIIGGRQQILSQVPKELLDKHSRLSEPLDSSECILMLKKALSVLEDESMAGSHMLFCDIIRLILALQLSVAEAGFKGDENATPPGKLNLII